MLKRYSHLFEGLFIASDLLVASLAWVFSYWLRFRSDLIPVAKGIPEFSDYLRMLVFVWLLWAFVFRRFGLYRPMRGVRRFSELLNVLKANGFAVVTLMAFTYLFREKSIEFSRLVFLIFLGCSSVLLVLSRSAIRAVLRYLRRLGHNIRYALVVGSGELAMNVVRRIRMHPEYGIELLGCLSSDTSVETGSRVRTYNDSYRVLADGRRFPLMTGTSGVAVSPLYAVGHSVENTEGGVSKVKRMRLEAVSEVSPEYQGVPIIGSYEDLPELLAGGGIDQVVVALPLEDHAKIDQVVSMIGDSIVDVKIVPDLHRFIQLGSQIEEFDGLPVVSLASTPLVGFNQVLKRAFDLLLASLFLLITAPLMVVVALLIKVTSRGPVFFRQERMGLDGRMFSILKFRTMRLDAEAQGARFAVKHDPRYTVIGGFLRRYSIDELPQLINVIAGQMSLVGPRPERPIFIEDFRRRIPKYMLRHKVQAGMTGWAQVNGWRGNTSIEKRIDHDLHYIENWSLAMDFKILFMTIFTTLFDRNAY